MAAEWMLTSGPVETEAYAPCLWGFRTPLHTGTPLHPANGWRKEVARCVLGASPASSDESGIRSAGAL